jgi:hypothetical protein
MTERLVTARELGDLLGFRPGTIVGWFEADSGRRPARPARAGEHGVRLLAPDVGKPKPGPWLGSFGSGSEVEATVCREAPASIPAAPFARRGVKVCLRLKLLQRLPIPLVGNVLSLIAHQLLEAVQLRLVQSIGVTETNSEQIDQVVKSKRGLRIGHARNLLPPSFVSEVRPDERAEPA